MDSQTLTKTSSRRPQCCGQAPPWTPGRGMAIRSWALRASREPGAPGLPSHQKARHAVRATRHKRLHYRCLAWGPKTEPFVRKQVGLPQGCPATKAQWAIPSECWGQRCKASPTQPDPALSIARCHSPHSQYLFAFPQIATCE